MTEPGVLKLVEFLGQAPHVCDIQIAEFVEETTITAFRDAIAANKPKKGKKGKGKKKKWAEHNNLKVKLIRNTQTYITNDEVK